MSTLKATLNPQERAPPLSYTYTRPNTIQGDPGTQLEEYLSETITVPPETVRDSVSSSFQLPPPQQPRP